MKIFDAQVHLNRLGLPTLVQPGRSAQLPIADDRSLSDEALVQHAVGVMDAIGIDAVLIDEVTAFDAKWRILPGEERADGRFVASAPFSETAIRLFPDRFAATGHVEPTDPELEDAVAALHAKPGFRCLRLGPRPEGGTLALFEEGGYARVFAAAERFALPIFITLPGRTPLLRPYLERFPGARVVIDHAGVAYRLGDSDDGRATTARQLAETLKLARYDQVHVKWSKTIEAFSAELYPFRDVMPSLRAVVDAFGPRRVLWASDHTETHTRYSWAEALHHLRDSDALREDEKAWLLGGAARTLIGWGQEN